MISQPLKASLAILLVALTAASCGTDVPETRASIDVGGTWTAINVAGQIPDRLDAPRVQFSTGDLIEGRRIQGATFCNDLSAEVRIDGDRIAIGPLHSKDVACPANVRDIELAFIGALRAAERITGGKDAGRLILTGPGGEIVFAQPAP